MQEVRASILEGKVHRICTSAECPHQRPQAAFPEPSARIQVKEAFARNFDEAWYLGANPDVREAVAKGRFSCGLEHFVRHGRAEGRLYKLVEPSRLAAEAAELRGLAGFLGNLAASAGRAALQNAVLALVEYSQGLTRLEAMPTDVVFVVSTICNLRCVMCPHGMGLVDSPRHMAAELVDKAAPAIAASSRMIISGLGEPTLAPAFWRILELTRGREGLFIRVNSNGHFLTPEKASAILDSRLSEISFSLDAATPGTYAKIRGGDFARALRGIATMLRGRAEGGNRQLEILINMTLMRENISEAAAFVALGKELGADGIIFTQLFAFGDRPDWRVDRGPWKFVYSEQMISRAPEEARLHISQARSTSEHLGHAGPFSEQHPGLRGLTAGPGAGDLHAGMPASPRLGSREEPADVGLDLRRREFPLGLLSQVAHLDDAPCELVAPGDDGDLRPGVHGRLELLAEGYVPQGILDPVASRAQGVYVRERGPALRLTAYDAVDVGCARDGRREPARHEGVRKGHVADGEAHGGKGRAAKLADEVVVAAAAGDRAQFALPVEGLEYESRVVGEAPDDAEVHLDEAAEPHGLEAAEELSPIGKPGRQSVVRAGAEERLKFAEGADPEECQDALPEAGRHRAEGVLVALEGLVARPLELVDRAEERADAGLVEAEGSQVVEPERPVAQP